jgi:hypothetical protein
LNEHLTPLHNDTPQTAPVAASTRLGLATLLGFHIVTCCLSLVYVAEYYAAYKIIWFDQARLYAAILSVALFAIVRSLFNFSRFSFGYFSFLHSDSRLSLDRPVFEI